MKKYELEIIIGQLQNIIKAMQEQIYNLEENIKKIKKENIVDLPVTD